MAEGVNVRVPERLKRFIDEQSGPDGLFESASEYVRDLIRKDYDRQESEKWRWLEAELKPGLAASEDAFEALDIEILIAEARAEKASRDA